MKWGRRVMGIARGRRRGRKFVNFAITAVLAFNRRGLLDQDSQFRVDLVGPGVFLAGGQAGAVVLRKEAARKRS